jgi:hypothetical protein
VSRSAGQPRRHGREITGLADLPARGARCCRLCDAFRQREGGLLCRGRTGVAMFRCRNRANTRAERQECSRVARGTRKDDGGLVEKAPAAPRWKAMVDVKRRRRLRRFVYGADPEPVPSYLGLVEDPEPGKLGICCSGGGIRSAAFNLGALRRRAGRSGAARRRIRVRGIGRPRQLAPRPAHVGVCGWHRRHRAVRAPLQRR